MSRRQLYCVFSLFLVMITHSIQAESVRPNFLVIMVDDLDMTASQYWEKAAANGEQDPLKMTKALIKDQGATFNQAFAPTPICCPARATILTGRLGHNTGVLNNHGKWGGWAAFRNNGNEEKTIAVAMQKAGYTTGLIGKYMNGLEGNPTHIPAGWDQWFGAVDNFSYAGYFYDLNENGKVVSYGGKDKDYLTDVIWGHAKSFLQLTEGHDEKPFFLIVAPTAPHFPIPPAPRHKNHFYQNATTPQTPNFREEDMSDKSHWLRDSRKFRDFSVGVYQDFDYRMRQGSLYAIDEMVTSLIEQLRSQGELENTYIIFLSDNGYNLGSHSLIHKMAPYEESIRIPFVVRGPGIKSQLELEEMVLLADLAPTIAELAGVNPLLPFDGVSLVGLLKGQKPKQWREDFIIQYIGGEVLSGIGVEIKPWMNELLGLDFPSYKALRNQNYMLVNYEINGTLQEELYDLKADAHQLNNLLFNSRKDVSEIYDKMKGRLEKLSDCNGRDCFSPAVK